MDRFLITGLPRSRGAWLSAVANMSAGVECFHEPCAEMDGWQDIRHIWTERDHRDPQYVGISDSMLGFHLPEILDKYSPQVLIIDRDIDEVHASLARMGIPQTRYCELLKERLDAIDDRRVVRVPFHDMRSPRVVMTVLQHLIPYTRIQPGKVFEMMHLNIQEDIKRTMRLAVERAGKMDRFIPAEVIRELVA